jgi:hypothetical protein
LPSFFQIILIANYKFFSLLPYKFINLFQPSLNIVKGNSICNIINDNYSIRASIVTTCNSLEPILTCCVPLCNLKFTTCSLTLSPLKFKNLIFYVNLQLRSQHRSCYSNYVQIFYRCTEVISNFFLLLSCQSKVFSPSYH